MHGVLPHRHYLSTWRAVSHPCDVADHIRGYIGSTLQMGTSIASPLLPVPDVGGRTVDERRARQFTLFPCLSSKSSSDNDIYAKTHHYATCARSERNGLL